MPLLPIITGQDTPVLRTKTQKVPQVTKQIKQLIKDMHKTVKHANGMGLAAPQIDQSLRLCLAMINGKMTPLINPEIIWKSEGVDEMEEGCLSLPNTWIKVIRPTAITLRYQDEAGQETERQLKDMDARVVQHEVDHLDGVLIVDHV